MEKVSIHEIKHSPSTASVRRRVGDALDTDGFALNYYELEPGESFSTTLHAHLDQEEVFYILSGTAIFATDDGTVTVEEGEIVRFEPGQYQHGVNRSDGLVTGLAIGSPKKSTESRIKCPHCEARGPPEITWIDERSVRVFQCRACDTEVARQT